MNTNLSNILALSCALCLTLAADAAPKKKVKPPAAAKPEVSVNASKSGNAESLIAGPATASDSPLVRAAKKAKAVRSRNAAEGRETAPMNDWMARSLGSLGPVPATSPASGALASAGIYDRRGPTPYPTAQVPRSAAAVRKDMATTSEQLLDNTSNDYEDEGAVERRMNELNHELPKTAPNKDAARPGQP